MAFDINGNFIVGNTTFETRMNVRVIDYGEYLPEIESSSPMIFYMPVKITSILNWMERNLHVEFEKEEDEEKLFYFLTEYIYLAKLRNKELGREEYPIVTKSLQKLKDHLIFLGKYKKNEDDEINVFKPKYRKEYKPSENNNSNNKNKELHLYDSFTSMNNLIEESTPYDNIELE